MPKTLSYLIMFVAQTYGANLVIKVLKKSLFAVGVFDAPESLESALEQLSASGWYGDQFCLAATWYRMQAYKADISHPGLAALLARVEECQRLINGTTVFASSGPVLEAIVRPLLQFDSGRQRADGFHLPAHLAGLLGRHIEQEIVLFVSSTSASRQVLSTRILLRNATHDVVAHEFVPFPRPNGE